MSLSILDILDLYGYWGDKILVQISVQINVLRGSPESNF